MMFARTRRLTLRPGWPEDAEHLTRAIAHREVAMRLARVPWPYALDDARAFLALPRGPHDASFLICERGDGAPRIVGGIGISMIDGASNLGYWLTPDVWGRGYATEAGRAVVEMARHALPVRRLVARHAADNPASGAVLRKLGFSAPRACRSFSLARGADVDSIEYTLTLEDDRTTPPLPMAA